MRSSENPFNALFDMTLAQAKAEIKRFQPPPSPVSWIEENFIDPITDKLMVLYPHQKRILRRALQMDDQGYSKYSQVVWSELKKSGKTTIAAAVGAWAACNIEAPNEISCVANDQEQAAGRIFANMQPTLTAMGWYTPENRSSIASSKAIKIDPASYGPNGTVVHAITTRYQKEAGANQGLTLWSELWAYSGERLHRLWEEMTPPPTRKFSMRWVETYAGFIGESLVLQSIYQRVFKGFEEDAELQPGVVKIWPDLPVYELDNGRTLVYWSHTPRMPWQTVEYYESQRVDLRSSAFQRLHKNLWVESSESFITTTMWTASLKEPINSEDKGLTYAMDASKNGDCTALVGSKKYGELVHTCDVHVWEPKGGAEVPYADMEKLVIKLFKEGKLKPPLWYDPYQLAYLAQRLRELYGIPCEEFSQQGARIRSDTFLYKLYNEERIRNPNIPKLRQHVLAASAREYDGNRLRIIKPEELAPDNEVDALLKKVDLAVAQSMSVYMAYHAKDGGWAGSGDNIAVGAQISRGSMTLEQRIRWDLESVGMIQCAGNEYTKARRILLDLAREFTEQGESTIAYHIMAVEIPNLDKLFG